MTDSNNGFTTPPYHFQGDQHIFVGWDPGENMAHVIACASIRMNAVRYPQIRRLALAELQAKLMYTRAVERQAGALYDPISQAPMSTEHAIARFFVPWYQQYKGWALFVDGDIICRRDIGELFALADPRYAVMVVKHAPGEGGASVAEKKGGMIQQPYPRKNWSSVMLFNCAHMGNRSLNAHALNTLPGRDLHRFCWLADEEIGELPAEWNYLVNVSQPQVDPAIAHFTLGTPNIVPSHTFLDAEWYRYGKMAGYAFAAHAATTNGNTAKGSGA